MTEFTAKKLENVRAIKTASTHVSNLVIPANSIKKEFERVFSYFDLNDLKSLMLSENKKEWIAAKFIELRGINTNQLSIEKLIELGLLQLPEYETLLQAIETFYTMLNSNSVDCFVKDLSEIYSTEHNEFVNPFVRMDDSPVPERIYKFYTVETINDKENKFLETLEVLANTYQTLVNDWKVINSNFIPRDFLTTSVMEGGFVLVELHNQVLRNYRQRFAKADVFKAPKQTEPTHEIELQENE